MAGVSVKVNGLSPNRWATKLEKASTFKRQVMPAIATALVGFVRESFRNQASPDGMAWAPKVCDNGKRILSQTGALKNAWHVEVGNDDVRVTNTMFYASVHQSGKRIRAKNAPYLRFRCGKSWVSKKEVRIPARPMLPSKGTVPAAWDADFKSIIDHAFEVLK